MTADHRASAAQPAGEAATDMSDAGSAEVRDATAAEMSDPAATDMADPAATDMAAAPSMPAASAAPTGQRGGRRSSSRQRDCRERREK